MSGRTRVLVLGGGCAGTAAALALSATPALRRRYAVRVVERSWRLGGKGATGRDPEQGWRIEEHGLHVWMGFYERTFAAVRGALEELGDDAAPRLRTFEDAFAPRHAFSVWDERAEAAWTVRLPQRPGLPGDGGPSATPTLAEVAASFAALARSAQSSKRGLRELGTLAALARVVARGLTRHLFRGDLAGLDDHDLRGWLRTHGACDAVAQAPVIRAFYDMTFAYPGGISGPNDGAVAAGAALRTIARILMRYRGAPFWLLKHGMGDTAFGPAYEVLTRRGVQFSWMHTLQRLLPDAGGERIETIELSARPLPAQPMLVEVDGLRVWPGAPKVAPGKHTEIRLRRGDDFDVVILAVPLPALEHALAPVATHHPHIERALRTSASVGTRAAQLWCRDAPRLAGITTGFTGGFPTFADLSEVLGSERWGHGPRPGGLVYLVDTVPDAGAEDPAELLRRWEAQARARFGTGPVLSRYVRSNLEPADRYVLTLPGSVGDRLRPDDARVANLRFAGDWTATSINGGSVEAAFESAEIAAASL